jgi:heterodisulfide reductase subunit B
MTTGKTALTISGLKLNAIQEHMFDGIVTVCPFCMKMLDAKQRVIKVSTEHHDINMPVLYYTQLLGLSMGMEVERVALNLNSSPVGELVTKLMER